MSHDDRPGQNLPAAQPTAAAIRPTGVRYLVLAACCLLAYLTYVQRQGFVAGTPYLKQDLGLDDEQMGYLLSAWLVAYGAFQVPGGLLGDRLGTRHLLTIFVLGWSLVLGSVALIAVLPAEGWVPFALLLALRFLFGAFQAGCFPGLARVVADWMPTSQRGFAQGLIWTFSRLGGFVAPLLVGLWLFKAFHGWAIPFVILASAGLFWCASFWPWFRNRPAEMRRFNWVMLTSLGLLWADLGPLLGCIFFWPWFRNRPAAMSEVNVAERALIASGQPAVAARPEPIPWSRFLASRNVWALCLMYGFVGFSGNFITNWLPSYLMSHRRLTPEETAWLTGLPLAFGIVSCVLGGVLSDWLIRVTGSANWGRRLVGCSSVTLAGLTILASIWVHDVWLLALTFSMAFFFNDGTMGPAWASCADIGERHAGTLSGAMNMTGSLFAAVAMSVAGALFHRHLDDVVFVAFACSYGLAALCWLAVDVTKPLVPAADLRV